MKDIVIIGAGIVGTSIAHSLSRYHLDVLVLEKEFDIAEGTTKANSAIIHAGFDCKPHTLKAKLNVRGNQLFHEYAQEYHFPFKNIGSLVLSFSPEDDVIIEKLYLQGQENAVPGLRILTKEEVLAKEPHLNSSISSALFAPTAAVVCPFEACLAFAENAVENGVEFRFAYPVTQIKKENDYYLINNEIQAKYIINAAGLFADEIAKLMGENQYTITPRKGEYYLLDKQEPFVQHVLFPAPSALGKGVVITPTVHGNYLVGPTAVNLEPEEKENTMVTLEGMNDIFTKAKNTLPDLPFETTITNFAGLRAIAGNDFIIEPSTVNPNCIHVIGICSPGLASAPAIGEYVTDLLLKNGTTIQEKTNYRKGRKNPLRISELQAEELDALIQQYPLYGKIVCRCELVSEQEIIDSFSSALPPTTMDGIKRRLRPGMGRCQGSFCGSRIMELLHTYGNIKMEELLKSSSTSYLLEKEIKRSKHE